MGNSVIMLKHSSERFISVSQSNLMEMLLQVACENFSSSIYFKLLLLEVVPMRLGSDHSKFIFETIHYLGLDHNVTLKNPPLNHSTFFKRKSYAELCA